MCFRICEMDCWEPPSPQSSKHLNERRHSEDFNIGTFRSVEGVRGRRHRGENRCIINAYTYVRVESVHEGRRRIEDGRRESEQTSRASNKPFKKDQTKKQGKVETGEENGERRRASGLPRRGPQREAACRTPLTGPKEQSHSETAKCGNSEQAILFEDRPSC